MTVMTHDDITFPEIIDNTILSSYKSCPTKMYWQHHRHASPKRGSIHLIAGGAYAKGLEVFRRLYYSEASPAHRNKRAALLGGLLELYRAYGYYESIEATDDDWVSGPKSCNNVALAYVDYIETYDPERDYLQPYMQGGEPAVEFSFNFPLERNHPTTGQPLIYCGRFDMLGVNTKYNSLWIVDEKTTTAMGTTWAKQWELRAQFMGYAYGAAQFGYNIAGAIVRGTALQKTQIKQQQCPVQFPHWMLERWYEDAHHIIDRMLEDWDRGHWIRDFGDACTSFGGCTFKDICNKSDPDKWIDMNFKHRIWNPAIPDLERGHMLIQEELAELGLL